VVGVILAAYGIAQPLILHELGYKSVGDDAQMISVLVTVVALLVAGLGVGIYRIADEALRNTAHKAAIEARKETEVLLSNARTEVSKSLVIARLNEAYDLWVSIEPLVVSTPPVGSWQEARRNGAIQAALTAATSAVQWTTDAAGKPMVSERQRSIAIHNLAFYEACSYRFVEPHNDRLRWDALGVIPQSGDLSELSMSGKDTVAWVQMCCVPQDDNVWKSGQALAKSLYAELLKDSRMGEADAMKRRFEATFHSGVLD